MLRAAMVYRGLASSGLVGGTPNVLPPAMAR